LASFASVVTDASFRAGRAGLAVTGAIGPEGRYAQTPTNVIAEFEAVLWAMELAHERGMNVATFATDCQAVARFWEGDWDPASEDRASQCRASMRARLRVHQSWQVIWVHSRITIDADRLASKVRAKHEPPKPKTFLGANSSHALSASPNASSPASRLDAPGGWGRTDDREGKRTVSGRLAKPLSPHGRAGSTPAPSVPRTTKSRARPKSDAAPAKATTRCCFSGSETRSKDSTTERPASAPRGPMRGAHEGPERVSRDLTPACS